jgi:Ca-activated chloride channel family protein
VKLDAKEKAMDRRTSIRMLLAAGAGSTLSALSAMLPTQPDDDRREYATFRSDVALVLLDVSVKNNEGRLVPGLTRENFSVFEGGRPRKITVFDAADRPVTLGILVDQSRSMTPKRESVLTAALSLVEASNPEDEVFILHFNDRVTPGLPSGVSFSGDLPQLRAGLSRGVPEGKTALHDAVVAGFEHMRLSRQDRKTLVLITDGGDTASAHTRRETIAMAERGTATIYAIGLYQLDDPDRDPGLLRQLAGIGGGEAFFPNNPSELAPLARKIAAEIRSRYTIGYLPAEAPTNTVRHIRVKAVSGQDRLRVRTRGSYRYE